LITHNDAPQSVGLLRRVINPSQRPLPDNTQHSQQTNIHVPGGIRTNNLSRRAAVDLRLRMRGHWDRQFPALWKPKFNYRLHTSPQFVLLLIDINQSTPSHPIQNLIRVLCFRLPQSFQVVSCPQVSTLKSVCTPSVSHTCCTLLPLHSSCTQLEFSLKLCTDRPPGLS